MRLTTQASGLSADLAWKLTTGRSDVVVAVLDSGIRWGDRDLVKKYYLNRGELPEPRDAQGRSTSGVLDRNGDGRFNVKRLKAAGPEAGLAGLAGGWKGSHELVKTVLHSRRSKPRRLPGRHR